MATATLNEPDVHTDAQHAPRYRVVLHGRKGSPIAFVVYVLQEVFKIEHDDAVQLWAEANDEEVATVAVLPRDVAELRYDQARSIAKTAKLELPLSVEPE